MAERNGLWIWDVYFGVCLAIVAVAVLLGTAPLAARVGAVTMLGLIGLWYARYGRQAFAGADGSRQSWHFVAGAVVLFLAAVGFAQLSSFALFALCPMVFLSLPIKPAVGLVAVLNVIPLGIGVLRSGVQVPGHLLLTATALGLAFTLLSGPYIDRLARQNEERARMISELEASRAEVARLSHEAGVATERARLAADIHDTLAQGFTSIVMLLQAVERELDADRAAVDRHLAMAVRTARDNLAEARALVAALGPPDLRSQTLANALRRQVNRLRDEVGMDARCRFEGVPGQLPTALEVVLLRTTQEALSNVRRHSRARAVTVELTCTDRGVTLTVADDGVGFDPDVEGPGFGLRGMRARAAEVAGALSVHSSPGAGTTVEFVAHR